MSYKLYIQMYDAYYHQYAFIWCYKLICYYMFSICIYTNTNANQPPHIPHNTHEHQDISHIQYIVVSLIISLSLYIYIYREGIAISNISWVIITSLSYIYRYTYTSILRYITESCYIIIIISRGTLAFLHTKTPNTLLYICIYNCIYI